MAKPFHELLAESLSRAENSATDGIIRSENISRLDRERLLKGGWLQPIISGWYLLASPTAMEDESTAWFASFWIFIQQYLNERFGKNYCLSAESSLDILTANNVIPKQVVVITKQSGSYNLTLPFHTSMIIYQDAKKFPATIEIKNNLQVMPLGLALCRSAKSFFQNQPMNAKIALSMLQDPAEVTRHLLQDGMLQAASRLAGACHQIGRKNFSEMIIQTMQAAGFEISEENPFDESIKTNAHKFKQRVISPHHERIVNMWELMRNDVIKHFPKRKSTHKNPAKIIQQIDEVYVNDAYNSLSIEGFKVSKTLIEKIRIGNWNPDNNEADFQLRNTLAAKGYYLAFVAIKESIQKLLQEKKSDAATIIQHDLSKWYQALFSPSVDAGIIAKEHLAGYRNDRVYIRHSLHTPPPKEAVMDCMDAFFTCLQNEENPIVRAVLGHFIFVFIHPYMDGNGRIGRFLMNALWIAADYPWTIVRLESRKEYLQSLEAASVDKNITPFTLFLAKEMSIKW